jgi:hypothetical protein
VTRAAGAELADRLAQVGEAEPDLVHPGVLEPAADRRQAAQRELRRRAPDGLDRLRGEAPVVFEDDARGQVAEVVLVLGEPTGR